MLPVNLLSAVKLALEPKPPQPTPVTAVSNTPKNNELFAQFQQNQRFQGVVQTQIAPGIFTVRVANQMFQLPLPANTPKGAVIPLQVISVHPRVTFALANTSTATTPIASPDALSSTARMLSAMARQTPEKAFVQAAQSTPLWDKPQIPEPKLLAGMLREALSNSGLFYESHQAQWMSGARSTAQLRTEPQNLTPEQVRLLTGQNAAQAAQETKIPGVPSHLQPLVQQQLNALETHQMVWQGLVWQGQILQWEIHDEASPYSAAEDQHQWSTELHLDLPNLGAVAATLQFSKAGVNLRLQADNSDTRATFNQATADLIAALNAAGIRVRSTLVSAE